MHCIHYTYIEHWVGCQNFRFFLLPCGPFYSSLDPERCGFTEQSYFIYFSLTLLQALSEKPSATHLHCDVTGKMISVFEVHSHSQHDRFGGWISGWRPGQVNPESVPGTPGVRREYTPLARCTKRVILVLMYCVIPLTHTKTHSHFLDHTSHILTLYTYI